LTSLQYREAAGGITKKITTLAKGADRAVLVRKGKKLIMRVATGEVPRRDNAEIEIDFPGEFYVGMFVCAHEAGVSRTAKFSEVRFFKQQQ
jgi:hypothetical protein